MLTPNQLERAPQAYRKGYHDGYANAECNPPRIPGVWGDFDYIEGYKAGINDKKWNKVYEERVINTCNRYCNPEMDEHSEECIKGISTMRKTR